MPIRKETNTIRLPKLCSGDTDDAFSNIFEVKNLFAFVNFQIKTIRTLITNSLCGN